MSQRDTGTHYENQARHYLERAGLVFKAANVTYQNGEIDLIMRDGDTWVFVEVRFRRNALFGGAAASVTYSKQQRLLRAATIWLAQRNACFATTLCRFDVFAITGSELEWLPNAFNAD
ncbi:YraN family protein [Yersinia enterocolitica]|uniref:YraN family protein n=1 Tax=Yersinia enterocolitica TaxID=630 RepID=UPI00155A7229|nr:YraN family protein [Yersinia enterocolitica]EKN3739112.1 YraN family protein [Yersinia enterocolitica]EKN5985376.1 YraN family protein [Yersinia enterocolitica]EKN5990488.1 YraN family protein [Yersinia enterocolitica]ELX2243486.1 YraN family protein [Yersinia enterocolitica]MBX9483489.1 YraN family protein [Yersinia enterocolitica]